MFSVIIPTCRDIKALEPLFITSDEDTEIIIIDSNYNVETKKWLEQLSHDFKKVIYAPSKKTEDNAPFNQISSINTGMGYSEEPWIIKMDDNWECKPDFYVKAQDAIAFLSKMHDTKFVLRPLELEPWNNDIKWDNALSIKERYIHLPCPPLRRKIPITTIGQVICHITAIYAINGWDERYDFGKGWNDNDMFFRFISAKYPIYLDKELMMYRHIHHGTTTNDGFEYAKNLFLKIVDNELKQGQFRSPNRFNFQELHKKILHDKKQYMVK